MTWRSTPLKKKIWDILRDQRVILLDQLMSKLVQENSNVSLGDVMKALLDLEINKKTTMSIINKKKMKIEVIGDA